jgi:glycosyltransferase involved in cell wall biosynthesis
MLERALTTLSRTLFPTRAAVRGDWVAVDYLTDALLSCGTADKYKVIVSPEYLASASASIASGYPERVKAGRIAVVSRADLLNGAANDPFFAFLAPQGVTTTAFRMRSLAPHVFPVSLVSHGLSGYWQIYDRFLRVLLSPTCSCDTIICTSRASRAVMANIFDSLAERLMRELSCELRYAGRLDVIPLCVDTNRFRPHEKISRRKQLKLPQSSLILLYLGRISPVKAELLPLLQVLKLLIQNNPMKQLYLVIAGTQDPLYGKVLEEQTKRFSLSNYVCFLKNLTDEQKLWAFQAADIFVSPADGIEESFGVAPVEAMSCGVPQVVSDWDGYRDTVNHGETGFLVPTYWAKADSDLTMTGALLGMDFDSTTLGASIAVDVAQLQSYLQVLIQNDQLRDEMSHRSILRAKSLFSFEAVANQYHQLWSELSELASGIRTVPRQNSIEHPRYFESFRGHASRLLDDDCQLYLTTLGRDINDTELRFVMQAQTVKFKVIDEKLIRIALAQLRDQEKCNRGTELFAETTFGALAANLEQCSEHHPDSVRRHVMWLIKHGLLRPELR